MRWRTLFFSQEAAKKVYLIHRRDELRATAILQKELMALPNVEILWDTVAERIEGEGQVQSLAVKNVKTGKAKELSVDGVFVAVGDYSVKRHYEGRCGL